MNDKHRPCWHTYDGEEEGMGFYPRLRMCCHCGTVERYSEEPSSEHGSHFPPSIVPPKTGVWNPKIVRGAHYTITEILDQMTPRYE